MSRPGLVAPLALTPGERSWACILPLPHGDFRVTLPMRERVEAQAAALAGALAERGVGRLVLVEADGRRRVLEARSTDLPGVLRGLPVGAMVTDEAGRIRIIAGPEGLVAAEGDDTFPGAGSFRAEST